jgi:hypothetical protein
MSVPREGRWARYVTEAAVSCLRWPPRAVRRSARLVAVLAPLTAVGCAGSAAVVPVGSPIAVYQANGVPPVLAGSIGTPPARCCAAIGFDPETHQVVMFGGLGVTGTRGDTWIWNGSYWLRPRLAVAPVTRDDASMIFDPKLHALVMVGGGSNAAGPEVQPDLNATWLWTGTVWERRATAHFPTIKFTNGAFLGGPLAYDSVTGRVVMVTTQGYVHFEACSTQTWTFDGVDWRLEHPATELPAMVAAVINEPQSGHVAAVLGPRPAVVPVGFLGTDCLPGSSAGRALPTSSTWRWSGSTWSQVSAGTEPGGATLGNTPTSYAVGLDPVAGAAMVALESDESLWSWNGTRWTKAPDSSATGPPLMRTNSLLSIDAFGDVMLFGGVTQPSGPQNFDTWVWNGVRWRAIDTAATPAPTPSMPPQTQDPRITTPAPIPTPTAG